MDNFLDRYKMPKLIQDQRAHLNNPSKHKEIEVVIKISPIQKNRKSTVPDGFINPCRILSTLERRAITNNFHIIPQNTKRRKTMQFVKPQF